MTSENELVFVPLGGLGEIGMNCALYGYGPANARQWLMVDLGVAFAAEDLPGIDLVMPDLDFIEKAKKGLAGIVITHAHEDHIGALAELWPGLSAPVYMTRFAAGLAEARRLGEPGAPRIPLKVVGFREKVAIGPFSVEFIPVAHSIPESAALAIRTPAGLVVHTADWKIDPTPVVGPPTDEARFRALGDEGVLALISNSTNVLREGESPSERDVARTLSSLVADAKGRVVVTTFASNVGRLRSAAEAGLAAGRQVCILGRAIERVVAVARDCGMLEGLPPLLGMDAFERLPRERILALATGSQGEPRAALARMAADEHPTAKLSPGDTVIFSSRTIPACRSPGSVRRYARITLRRNSSSSCARSPAISSIGTMTGGSLAMRGSPSTTSVSFANALRLVFAFAFATFRSWRLSCSLVAPCEKSARMSSTSRRVYQSSRLLRPANRVIASR